MESKVKIRTTVVEIEPGWLLAKFEGKKPPAGTRLQWLQRTLRDWQTKHGGRQIERTSAVQHRGQLMGLMAWTPVPRLGRLRIHRALKTPKEHLEALLEHAKTIYLRESNLRQPLLVVNRSGVAAVFDQVVTRVAAIDDLPLSERMKAAFHEWQTTNEQGGYFVARLNVR